MQKIPYFSGRTKLNHFNSTMSGKLVHMQDSGLARWAHLRSSHPFFVSYEL